MSLRSFGDSNGKKGNGKISQKAKGRILSASLSAMEPLEQRQLLNAQVHTPAGDVTGVINTPLAPKPGVTFWANGNGTSAAYQSASLITPNTVNDLVLNVTAFAQNYAVCCEANGSPIGNTGSVNAGRLLTNGLTQNQIGGFPATGAVAATGDGGASDNSSGANVLSNNNSAGWWLEYNLGTAPGQTASPNGYDLSEIDVIAGHQDTRVGMQVDIQVQFLNGNSTDWFSLSNGANFSFTADNGGVQIGRGSAQMAIINNAAGPMASNVRSVKFVAANQQTWFRELVVTGTASTGVPLAPGTMAAPTVANDPRPGVTDISYHLATNGPGYSYSLQRAPVVNGTVGTFTQISGVVTFIDPVSFVDSSGAAGTTYVYRVVASNPTAPASTSPNSLQIITPPIAVEAHFYNMSYWEGPVTSNGGLAIMSTSNGGSWGSGIRGSQDSAVFTGKITTPNNVNATGTYTFLSNTDDDGYLYINGALVSFDPGGHGQRLAGKTFDINGAPQGTYIPISLAANTSYDFVLLEHNSGGGAGANIDWVTPSAPGTTTLVPIPNLSPQSSHPTTPTGLTTTSVNSNFVNFTFTGENNAVVHYILQRAVAGQTTTNWVTVNQIDPASDTRTFTGSGVNAFISGQSAAIVTIQDADPIPGISYIYRVGAVNFDGAAYSPTTQATLTPIADIIGTPSGAPILSIGSDLVSPPNTAAGLTSTTDATGLPVGTYFVKYTWTNNLTGESQSSAEQSIVVAAASDIAVGLPAAPFAASNANVFISSTTGTEKFAGTVAGGATLTIKTLPIFSSRSAPTSSVATLATAADSTSSLATGTYFVEYVWNNAAGQHTAATMEQTIAVTTGNNFKVTVPSAPSGASNASVYISTVSGAELLAGTTAGSTLVIKALPATTAAAAPTTNTAGLVPGTYFVKYDWVDNFGNQSPGSPERTIVLTEPLSDIRVGSPTPSNSAANVNIYMSSTTGTEKLAGTVARGSTFAITTLATGAAAPATPLATFGTAADATGLPAGTYFVEYTWITATGGETAASFEQSVVTAGTGDLVVTLPTAPAGAVKSSVYVSSTSGGERLAVTVNAGQTAVIRGLPFSLATAAPTNSNAGLVPGTYFIAYTWVGDNSTVTGESSIDYIDPTAATSGGRVIKSDEKSIVITQTSDLVIGGFGAAPAGVTNVNVYIGTATNAERLVGTVAATSSLTVKVLPSTLQPLIPTSLNNTTAPVSSPTGVVSVPLAVGNSQGVEIHMYNQELFERFANAATNNANANAVAQNGLATEYLPQTSVQTIGSFNPGPIDRDYGVVLNPLLPPPNSPDATLFPDVNRIHTESFAQAFTGNITTTAAGVYTIISSTDDEGYVWLNGQLVSADPGGHGQQDANPLTGAVPFGNGRSQDTILPVFLQSGQSYDLVMFQGQGGGGSAAHLKWVMPALPNDHNQAVVASSNTGAFGATVTLASFASGSPGFYNNFTIYITSGPGAGEAGIITSYDNNTQIAGVSVTTNGSNLLWSTLPTTASQYSINYVEAIPLAGADSHSGGGLSLRSDQPNEGIWTNPTTNTSQVTLFPANSAAQSLTITAVSPTAGVSLSWVDQGLDELWYEVQRSTDGVNFQTIGTTPMNIGTTFTDINGGNAFNSPTISYFYRVRGVNFDGAGVFAPTVDTAHNVLVPTPSISSFVHGKAGTAGLILTGGSVNAGGLDVRYATLTGSTTGSFIDATPIPLPSNTFDYQITGLTPSQAYVFEVGNVPLIAGAIPFSTPKSFTPSAAINEAFGTPGSGVGGFTSAGDLQVNGNAALTGAGSPAIPTPVATLPTDTAPDIADPGSPATFTSGSDVPAPSVQGALTTQALGLGLTNAASFFLEYTWVTGTGETLPLPGAQGVTNTGWAPNTQTGVSITYQVPSAAPAGAVNANIYIGTSTNASDELLKSNVAFGTQIIINTFPNPSTSKSAPASSTTGVPPGTYYIEYSWLNASNQESGPSTEQSVIVTNPSNDITVTLPTVPDPLITSANIYIGTSAGGEHLSGTQAVSGTTVAPLIIRGLPATNAQTPHASQVGLGLATYFLEYTFVSPEPNQGVTGETSPSPMQSVVISAPNNDVVVQLPQLPAGVASANVYMGAPVANPGAVGTTLTATTGGSLAAGTYFVNYEWFTTSPAATLPSTAEGTIAVAASGAITVVTPAIPVGAAGAKIFVGTAAGAETLSGTASGNVGTQSTFVISALPGATAAGFDTANTTGTTALTRVASGGSSTGTTVINIQTLALGGTLAPINSPAVGVLGTSVTADLTNPPQLPLADINKDTTFGDSLSSLNSGVYYVQYSWQGNGGETAASPEQTFTLVPNTPPHSFKVTVPAAPVGAGNANIYIGTVSGGEQLSGAAAGGGNLLVRSLPSSSAKVAPTVSTIGIAPGTYYVAFTWTSGNGLETAGNIEQTVTLTNSTNDLNVTIPTAPVGAGAARVYLGTAPGQEFFAKSGNGGTSLTITQLPTINNRIIPTVNSTTLRYFTPANALQLNNNNNGQAGSVYNAGEDISGGFTTSFDFQLTGNMSADGFGFVLQNTAQNVVGGNGGNFGYNTTNHSVGVFFETFTGSGALNSTGLGVNGSNPGSGAAGTSAFINMGTLNGVPTGVQYSDSTSQNQRIGDFYNVALVYDNNAKVLTETVTDKTLAARGVPNSFTTSYSIDIVGTLGMPAAYAGFTAGSGGASSEKDILNWTFTPTNFVQLDVIPGTPLADTITLKRDGTDATKIDWNIAGNTVNYQMSITDVNGLTINGLGGNDIINLDYSNGNPLPALLKLNQPQGGTPAVNTVTINGLDSTHLLSGTTLDIGTSKVFIKFANAGVDPIASIKQYLTTGYGTNTWAGNAPAGSGSIRSSAAALNPNTFDVGYADSADGSGVNTTANSIEIMYTLTGDQNLDGRVSILDFNQLSTNFGLNAGAVWTQGDFNYDGRVSILDFNPLSSNFGSTLPAGGPAILTAATPATASSSTTSNSSLASVTPSVTISTNTSSSASSSAAAVGAASSVSSDTTGNIASKKHNKKKHK